MTIVRKKFFFVRHAVTEWNKKQLCQGQLDIELNEAGRLEAKALGEFIKIFPFLRICTSPLKRALETAEIIQRAMPNCSLQTIDSLKERGWGELEGISSEEMYQIEELEEMDRPLLLNRGIEDRNSFKSRILSALNTALSGEGTSLIVSHGRVFLSICELLHIPLIRQIPNATLLECIPTTEEWQINFIKGA
ncbi:MAG: histidine phosphatase family protein [Chlamydia sp.]